MAGAVEGVLRCREEGRAVVGVARCCVESKGVEEGVEGTGWGVAG